ncbi:MAG TPA: sigma E protease regulator RseP [Gammaproteobacteria bacterium]
MGILQSLLAFIVAIGVLVTVHEFGHFWVARRMGVKVLRFSVGFGRPLWRWRSNKDQTEYVIGSLPLGGYVKMLDEREGHVDRRELDYSFNRKSVWQRSAIVAAGPLFNFLFAILAYYLIFLAGIGGMKPVLGEVANPSLAHDAGLRQGDVILAVNGIETRTWEKARLVLLDQAVDADRLRLQVQDEDLQISDRTVDISGLDFLQAEQIDLLGDLGIAPWQPNLPPIIDEVLADGAGERAGLQSGDRVVSLDGVEIDNSNRWIGMIRENPQTTMRLRIVRDGESMELELTPDLRDEDGARYGYIGVRSRVEIPESLRREMTVVERYGPLEGFAQALDKTWRMTWLTLRVLGKLVTGEASVRNLSGPITIAHYAGISASIGLEPFLGFLAIISISLGVLNLLPVPMLDGGHLFYYLIEIFKGSPVSEQTEIIGQKIGIALLFCLMSIALYNDLLRLVE